MNKDNRKFVGGESLDPLLPVFKGKRTLLYPGQLALNKGGYASSGLRRRSHSVNSCLRRYVFRFENDTFVYLATRKGQRNGGFNSKNTQQTGTFYVEAPAALPTAINTVLYFFYIGKNLSNEDVYRISANSQIRYDSANTRWVWETRPATTPPAPPSGPFYVTAFSSTTSNTLINSGTINEVTWTYVSDPFNTATPQVPATISIQLRAWYNNNDKANLNKWPIINTDANYGPLTWKTYKWQSSNGPEKRPRCLTDSILFKCFEGVPLKAYETVFIEIQWTFFANRVPKYYRNGDGGWSVYSGYWGFNNISDIEWWSPMPYKEYSQKGRIYRIGKLDADHGVGGIDTVIFEQRTRVITTKYSKGGFTALE